MPQADAEEKERSGRESFMYIIAGLGNPGSQYRNTRHNAGFAALDCLAGQYQIDIGEVKHKALSGKGRIGGERVVLVKPMTFMNLSGEAIRRITDYYKIDVTKELIVLYDDISLPPGQLRVRGKGSAGGHNGIKNIIAQLGTQEFKRVRIGVGEKPKGYDLADYVLGYFSGEENELMQESFRRAAEAVCMILEQDIDAAMNAYNKKA